MSVGDLTARVPGAPAFFAFRNASRLGEPLPRPALKCPADGPSLHAVCRASLVRRRRPLRDRQNACTADPALLRWYHHDVTTQPDSVGRMRLSPLVGRT